MAVGNEFWTETHPLRCLISDSVQEEVPRKGLDELFTINRLGLPSQFRC
jgi:hypothetical protein